MDGDGTPKDLRPRLRKENRCFRCKKKGHWKAECPEKKHNKNGTAPAVFSASERLDQTVGKVNNQDRVPSNGSNGQDAD